MSVAIPATVEELDADWFRAALQSQHNGIEIENAHIVEVIGGTCTKIRVALDYRTGTQGDWPATIILKGGFAAHSPSFREMHETEMRYYRDIAPRAGFDTPRCFYAELDPASGRSAVIIEDMDARPVRWLSALSPLDWRDEAAFVDALAGFAARWWESPELAVGGRLEWVIHSYEREAAAYIDHYLEPDRWAHFVGLPRCACLPRIFHDRERMRSALSALAKRLDRYPVTLSHGDTHLGNLYINSDGTPGFVDAQPRRAAWVKDFAYQLVAALDVEDRRAWERPLLERYLRKLRESAIEGVPDLEEAWYDYRCEIAYGLFIFMINESHFQREEVNTAFAARFGTAALDHRTFDLLR